MRPDATGRTGCDWAHADARGYELVHLCNVLHGTCAAVCTCAATPAAAAFAQPAEYMHEACLARSLLFLWRNGTRSRRRHAHSRYLPHRSGSPSSPRCPYRCPSRRRQGSRRGPGGPLAGSAAYIPGISVHPGHPHRQLQLADLLCPCRQTGRAVSGTGEARKGLPGPSCPHTHILAPSLAGRTAHGCPPCAVRFRGIGT